MYCNYSTLPYYSVIYCKTPVLGQFFNSRLKLGVDFLLGNNSNYNNSDNNNN